MTGPFIVTAVLLLAITLGVIVVAVYLLRWLYRRSTREVSFVRTGLGGQRVVIDGGAFVLPVVHDITPVNMSVLRMGVSCAKEQALITRDRMRVDLEADFYVRVAPTVEAVAAAAQTLGGRTMEQQRLHELLVGKFIGALRSVAAETSMEEMHEGRGKYVVAVKTAAAEALAQNGLELESVAITDLDQTDLSYFNPSNRFDAEGLTKLTEEIESRRKLRNDIEQESALQIRTRNGAAERSMLEVERESEIARLEQEREIESRRAAQRAQIASERYQREAEASQAEIQSREVLETARIKYERTIAEARIAGESETQQREIDRRRAIEEAELAAREETEKRRLAQERTLTEARLGTEEHAQMRGLATQEALEKARIDQEKSIALVRIQSERETRQIEIERTRTLEIAELDSREEIEKRRFAQQQSLAETRHRIDREVQRGDVDTQSEIDLARIESERQLAAARLQNERETRLLEITRDKVIEATQISAREETEGARIRQEGLLTEMRVATETEVRQREAQRRRAADEAVIEASGQTESMRIASELRVDVERIAAEAERSKTDIDRRKGITVAEHDREIDLAAKRAQRVRAESTAQQSEIAARMEVESAQTLHQRANDELRVESERLLHKLEVARRRFGDEAEIEAGQIVEHARILSERELEEARIRRDRDIRKIDIARVLEVELAELEKATALHAKVRDEKTTELAASDVLAKAAEASERVVSARDIEAARRQSTVDLMIAEAKAKAAIIDAGADKARAEVQAHAQRLLNEAENILNAGARDSLVRRKLLDKLEGIVRESVRPMERIEGIRILHVDGFNGASAGGERRSPTDEVMESALRYRVQAPMIDSLMREVGIEGGSVTKMTDLLRDGKDILALGKEAARTSPTGKADGQSAEKSK